MRRRTIATISTAFLLTLMAGIGTAAASSWAVGLNGASTSGARAAAINAPTGGAAAASPNSSLAISWTAPSAGAPATTYLVNRDGASVPSGSGCSGAVSSTSCIDSGLTVGVTYTYSVRSVRNNWTSSAGSSFQGTPGVNATLLGSSVDTTSNSSSSTGPTVTTGNGKTVLMLIYRDSKDGADSISTITGPFTAATKVKENLSYQSKHYLYAWRAVGNGTSGAVSVTFSGATNLTTLIQVVELSGNDTANPIVQSTTDSGNSGTATAALSAPSASDGEIVLVGPTSNVSSTAPSGFSTLGLQTGSSPSPGYAFRTIFSPSAQATATSTLATSTKWGTLALQIKQS